MKTFSLPILLILTCNSGIFSAPIFRPVNFLAPSATEMIRSNLSIVGTDGTPTLVDGDLTQYDASYSNAVDGMDARKMTNFSENIGMDRSSTILVIERRHTIETADSIFYKMWNLKKVTYQLQFITSNLNHPGLSGYLEDDYLHQNTPLDLNGTNNINFTVTTDPGSAGAYRFKIIFTTSSARLLPLTFTSVNAIEQNNAVTINWKTANENDLQQYNIERSTDGIYFKNLDGILAHNLSANNYSWNDHNPIKGTNYYRIQSKDMNGQTSNSEVLKINTTGILQRFVIYPNPVRNNRINLQIINQPQGNYTVRLFNTFGQEEMKKILYHAGGNANVQISTPENIVKGIHQLEIINPDGSKNNLKIVF